MQKDTINIISKQDNTNSPQVVRNPRRVIFTSSPDRGLQQLLEIWPDVMKAVPDAELEVFYGFQLFDKFHAGNPASMQWKAKIVAQLSQPGIVKHGRLSQPELAEEMLTCGIWAYPATFQEINCISAIKAQAYGCVPVVMNEAALQTTVQFGIKIDGDIYDDEVKEAYKEQLIALLKDSAWQERIRKPMQEWAKQITWDSVAKQWTKEFKGEVTEAIITKPETQDLLTVHAYGGGE